VLFIGTQFSNLYTVSVTIEGHRSGARKCAVPVALSDLYECPTRAGHRQGQEIAYFTRAPMRSAIAKTGGETDNKDKRDVWANST